MSNVCSQDLQSCEAVSNVILGILFYKISTACLNQQTNSGSESVKGGHCSGQGKRLLITAPSLQVIPATPFSLPKLLSAPNSAPQPHL